MCVCVCVCVCVMQVTYLCERVMSAQCIQSLGYLGCAFNTLSHMDPPWYLSAALGGGGGGGGGNATSGSSSGSTAGSSIGGSRGFPASGSSSTAAATAVATAVAAGSSSNATGSESHDADGQASTPLVAAADEGEGGANVGAIIGGVLGGERGSRANAKCCFFVSLRHPYNRFNGRCVTTALFAGMRKCSKAKGSAAPIRPTCLNCRIHLMCPMYRVRRRGGGCPACGSDCAGVAAATAAVAAPGSCRCGCRRRAALRQRRRRRQGRLPYLWESGDTAVASASPALQRGSSRSAWIRARRGQQQHIRDRGVVRAAAGPLCALQRSRCHCYSHCRRQQGSSRRGRGGRRQPGGGQTPSGPQQQQQQQAHWRGGPLRAATGSVGEHRHAC